MLLLSADREAPVGWVCFYAFADSTFEYGLSARDQKRGTFSMRGDTLYLTSADSTLGIEKVTIRGDRLAFYGKKTPGFATITLDRITEGDTLFKFRNLMFEAKKNAKFELVRKGAKRARDVKGDTLYQDDSLILFGNMNEISGAGIFTKFRFKATFEEFGVKEMYTGKLAAPNFKTDPAAKMYVTRIRDGCREMGVNFAGHYTIIEFGCGTCCQLMAIVDRISGDILYSKIPFDFNDGHCGSDYRPDSRMLVINTDALSETNDLEPGYSRWDYWRVPMAYEMKDGKLKRIE